MTTGTATPQQVEEPSHTPAQTRDGSALGEPPCSRSSEADQKRRAYQAAWMRQWRKKNKARDYANKMRYESEHVDVLRARQKRYREKHKARVYALTEAWAKAHPDRIRELGRNRRKRHIAELRGHYVRQIIARHLSITTKEIPESFVQLYREYMKLNRLCKKSRTSAN
jgi:hypothetical protein